MHSPTSDPRFDDRSGTIRISGSKLPRRTLPTLILGWLLAVSITGLASAEEERSEVLAERTVFTKTFDYGDGSIGLHSGIGPLHFADPSSGEMLDIDPTLNPEDGWRNETNSFPVHLPPQLGDGSPLRFGPGLGVSWRPGLLRARLISGAEEEIAPPSVAWGELSEERPNTVVYAGLYPGLDLHVEVRRGEVNLELVLREWRLEWTREQVDSLFVEGLFDIPQQLLEAVQRRSQEGEALDEIPLYLGRGEDDYAIAVLSDPGLFEPQLEEFRGALYKDQEGAWMPAPLGWRSTLGEWLATGAVRHYVRYPVPGPGEESGTGVTSSALMASFTFTGSQSLDLLRFFALAKVEDPLSVQSGFLTLSRCGPPGPGGRFRIERNQIWAAKGDQIAHRAFVQFAGLSEWRKQLGKLGSWTVSEVSLGKLRRFYLPPGGVVGYEDDGVVAVAVEHLFRPDPEDDSGSIFDSDDFDRLPDTPYSLGMRPAAGSMIETGTWDIFANAGFTIAEIAGESFLFGPLSNTAPGASVPRAVKDFVTVLKNPVRNTFSMFLLLPQDQTTCVPCTSAHHDPAVQALAGDYRVGAGFNDLRLEIRAQATNTTRANVSATSVGGHNDELYPGESLDWDIELDTLPAGAGDLELIVQEWRATEGVNFSFRDPANPSTVLANPRLTAVGQKVRLRATWQRAQPSLYGKTRDLLIDGYLQQAGVVTSGQVKIPVKLKAPTGQPSLTPIYTTVDDDIVDPMGLAWIGLPSQTRGAALGQAQVRWLSGPTRSLQRGVHWDLWSSASQGHDGELVIYPNQFSPGNYTLALDPCLLPAGLPAPVHCAAPQTLSLEVRSSGTPGIPKPVIDFVAPWSVDNPSAGAVTVSVFGTSLGGAAGTTVTIPQVVSNAAPAAGSSATRVNVPVTLSGGSFCGPRQLSLTTAGGTASATFNITRPFAGSPNHFVAEAEGAKLNGLKIESMSGASGGQVVGIASDGAPGNLILRFQVPATSSSYQLYAVYGTPELNAVRTDLTLREGGAVVRTFKVALPQVNAGQRSLRAIYDASQSAPPTLLTLEAGKTYDLEIASRAGQRYPLLDLLVLSDGSLPPTLSELCR